MERKGFSTKLVHAGEKASEKNSLSTPIYQTASFKFDSLEQVEDTILRKKGGFVYSRVANPTQTALEEKMAALEGGHAALAFSSGMAAISASLLSLAKNGDHIIADEVLYGSTLDLFSNLKSLGIELTLVDASDLSSIENSIRPDTKAIFFETPTNPTMRLIDIKEVSKIARRHDIKVVVDNTFMTPYFQQPLKLGADVVVHSATKYLNGHGDALAGVIVGGSDFIKSARIILKNFGGAISPFNAWLVIRGIKTLALRMERHNENALMLANFLEEHPKVKRVMYPGLESHQQYALGRKQMSGSGGILSFELHRGVREFLNNLRLCSLAVSLGDVKTLIQHPATMTHAVVPEKEKLRISITNEMIRISVGIEDIEDIISDISCALDKIH